MAEGNGAKIVADAILGLDVRTCIVGGKVYVLHPPTIRKLAGAAHFLADIADCKNIHEVLSKQPNIESLAHAFSWLVSGDNSKYEQLLDGTFDELVEGLEMAYSLLSPVGFSRLSHLTMSVVMMTAKPK